MVRTLRKGANDNYVGIVKIELGSEQEAETVLQNAKKLAEHPDPSVSRIFIRPSKPDIERMNDRSLNAVLDVVDPNRSSLFVHPKWGGVRKTRGGFRGGNRRGHGRGRGRGARGARGRGRGQYQSEPDFENAWSPSLAPNSGRGAQGRGMGIGRGSPSLAPDGDMVGRGPYRPLHRSNSSDSIVSHASADIAYAQVPAAPPFSTFTVQNKVINNRGRGGSQSVNRPIQQGNISSNANSNNRSAASAPTEMTGGQATGNQGSPTAAQSSTQ